MEKNYSKRRRRKNRSINGNDNFYKCIWCIVVSIEYDRENFYSTDSIKLSIGNALRWNFIYRNVILIRVYLIEILPIESTYLVTSIIISNSIVGSEENRWISIVRASDISTVSSRLKLEIRNVCFNQSVFFFFFFHNKKSKSKSTMEIGEKIAWKRYETRWLTRKFRIRGIFIITIIKWWKNKVNLSHRDIAII